MSTPVAPMTSALLEALPAKGAPYYQSVGGCPGLVVCVLPSGRKTFSLTYRSPGDGKPKRLKVGVYPITSLKDARKRAMALLGKVAGGTDPVEERKAKKAAAVLAGKDSIEAVAAEFVLRHCKAKGRKAWATTERHLGRHLIPELGKRPISSVKRREVVELLDGVHDDHGPVEANRCLSAIRAMFNWAVRRDIIESSVCALIEKPGLEVKRTRVLGDDEIRALWLAAEEIDNWRYGAIVKLLLLNPQRRSEVGGLIRPEIMDKGRLWTIGPDRTKTSLPLEVPWHDASQEIVAKLPKHEGAHLFPSWKRPGKPINAYGDLKDQIAKLAGAEEWSDWRLHDLRRTVRTRMSAIGIEPEIAELTLGHVLPGQVRQTYDCHSYRPEKKRALALWADELHSIISVKPMQKAA